MTPWLWPALLVLAVIGGFVSHHLTVQEMMQRMRFVAMDSRDTFYLANLGSFESRLAQLFIPLLLGAHFR